MDPLVSSLTTLAFGAAITVVAFNTPYIGGAQSFSGIPPLTNFWEVYLALALVLFAAWRFDKSRLGMAAQACRANEIAASAMGVPVGRVKVEVFAIGAGVAALGGAFRAHFILVQSANDLGFWVSVNYLIFWVFGGSYSFWGPAAGALILTVVPEFLRFSDAERFVIYGLLLTAFVIVRPQGLVGRWPTGVAPGGSKLGALIGKSRSARDHLRGPGRR
jgi:branched-chain amino acid transport system permease protein